MCLLRGTDCVFKWSGLRWGFIGLKLHYLCVLYLSENKQRIVYLQHKLIGFYNPDEKCLQRGTDWVFK